MAKPGPALKTVKLTTPVTTDDLRGLEIGTVVYLDGVVSTGREGIYKRAVEEGAGLPPGSADAVNVSFHCSPAVAVDDDGTVRMGAVTATASFRFTKWLDAWFEMTGCKIIIGKGGMPPEVYREKFVPHGAIYLTTVGYGTGALLGRGIRRVTAGHWVEELGLAQAMWVIEVANFGPFLVESDLAGNSLFERENAKIAEGIGKLYDGLKPAILKRYGETDRREDEVI